jgi:homoserine kinase
MAAQALINTVTVSIPATSANLGPGFDALGLALSLHNTVRLSRAAGGINVEIQGEGIGVLPADQTNVVVQAAQRIFDHVGERPDGLHFVLTNGVPPGSGLGSSAAALVGGVVAANALLDDPLSRDEVLQIAVEMEGHPDNACAAMLGGLVISSFGDSELIYRRVGVAGIKVAIALPDVHTLTEEMRALLPKTVSLKDAASNIGRAALVVQALAEADYDLLGQAMRDRLHEPYRKTAIPGYDAAVKAAYESGAAAVAISGAGPSLIAFGPENHERIGAAMARALEAATGKPARTWALAVDTRGTQVAVT